MFSLSIISCKAIFCPLSFDRYHENSGAGIKKRQFNLHSTKNKRSEKLLKQTFQYLLTVKSFLCGKNKSKQNKIKQ